LHIHANCGFSPAQAEQVRFEMTYIIPGYVHQIHIASGSFIEDAFEGRDYITFDSVVNVSPGMFLHHPLQVWNGRSGGPALPVDGLANRFGCLKALVDGHGFSAACIDEQL
jgi:hypothetical protein